MASTIWIVLRISAISLLWNFTEIPHPSQFVHLKTYIINYSVQIAKQAKDALKFPKKIVRNSSQAMFLISLPVIDMYFYTTLA